jgi:ribosome assembly protein YihI (activator of Der GTPase)
MNRFEKKEKRKYNEARKGLSQEQIAILDEKERLDARIDALAHEIHVDKFPEEYDFIFDSSLDIADRNKGINPMNQDYIDRSQAWKA